MPRKNRRAPEPVSPRIQPRSAAPPWALVPGFDVRHVGGEKAYRCPGCDQMIREGVWHLVILPRDEPDERRHWHTECWRTELRRIR